MRRHVPHSRDRAALSTGKLRCTEVLPTRLQLAIGNSELKMPLPLLTSHEGCMSKHHLSIFTHPESLRFIAAMIPPAMVSTIAATARIALDPDGMGFRRAVTTMIGGIAVGTLVGHALAEAPLSAEWQSALVAGSAFLARDLAYMLLKQAARYREDPWQLVRDLRAWRITRQEVEK